MEEIGELCREKNVYLHTDAAQAVGKIPIDVKHFDFLSLTGHKFYGPKGIGALYVRRKPRVRLHSQMSGGGQEKGLRSGTLAPNLVVGLGEACRLAKSEMENDNDHISQLTRKFLKSVRSIAPNLVINGDEQ